MGVIGPTIFNGDSKNFLNRAKVGLVVFLAVIADEGSINVEND
jgi:hypothetical protein